VTEQGFNLLLELMGIVN